MIAVRSVVADCRLDLNRLSYFQDFVKFRQLAAQIHVKCLYMIGQVLSFAPTSTELVYPSMSWTVGKGCLFSFPVSEFRLLTALYHTANKELGRC